jgi:hypothetical protein
MRREGKIKVESGDVVQLIIDRTKSPRRCLTKLINKQESAISLFEKCWNQCKITLIGHEVIEGEIKSTRIKLDENHHQHGIFEGVMNLLMSRSRNYLTEHDAFEKHHEPTSFFYGHNYKPDFVFVKKNMPCKSYYCSFLVELQLGSLNEDHKGRLLVYNIQVLESLPMRGFVISALTNLDQFILMKTQRVANHNMKDTYIHEESIEVNFWNRGIEFLHQMLDEPLCVNFNNCFAISFKVHNKNYFITNFLGNQKPKNKIKNSIIRII